MPVINFPIPTYVGEPYTFNNKTWIWNGYAWDFNGVVSIVPSIGFESHIFSHGQIDPVDNTSYYFGDMPDHLPLTSIAEEGKIYCLYKGEVIDYSLMTHPGSTGTGELNSYYLVNETKGTEVLLSDSVKYNETFNIVSEITPPFQVDQYDKLYIRWETPAWTSNPIQVKTRVEIKIRLTA